MEIADQSTWVPTLVVQQPNKMTRACWQETLTSTSINTKGKPMAQHFWDANPRRQKRWRLPSYIDGYRVRTKGKKGAVPADTHSLATLTSMLVDIKARERNNISSLEHLKTRQNALGKYCSENRNFPANVEGENNLNQPRSLSAGNWISKSHSS